MYLPCGKCCCFVCFVLIAAAAFLYIQMYSTSCAESKRQKAIWRMECELGVIADANCPVDGGWTAWEAWSRCHGSCDDIGHRRRQRQCSNPPPSNNGLFCIGPEEEIEPCQITNCTVVSFRNIIAGDFTRIQAFRLLKTVPAMMERCLQTECPYEAIEAALLSDNTWQLEPVSLWNALQCVKRNLGCPLPGEWGPWGLWAACSSLCGPGVRWRLRRCDSPLPSDDHLVCEGSPLRSEACVGYQCAAEILSGDYSVSGEWSKWAPWTECSEKCGAGVRRRRRMCLEQTKPSAVDTWGTYCIGQHDQIEVCRHKRCVLDGGWSGWSPWGPCSQTCGAGRKSRTRTCTRPSPSGGGKKCPGLPTESASCYLYPCAAYWHMVAIMNGESYLHYNLQNKRATLFHVYVRFLVQGPYGTIVRRTRGPLHNSLVRLSLRNWHLCLDATGSTQSCTVPRICSPSTLDPDVWHSALVTVTNAVMTLRIDDARLPMKQIFTCDPDFKDEGMNIHIGENLHGAIQELAVNFVPLVILPLPEDKPNAIITEFLPTLLRNVVIATPLIDEGFLPISDGLYIRLPCSEQEHWRLEITARPTRESGTLLFMGDQSAENWLHMYLQNRRIKLKIVLGDFKSESTSFTECPPNQWLQVTLARKKEANIIEASINSDERIHVILDDVVARRRRIVQQSKRHLCQVRVLLNQSLATEHNENKPELSYLCQDEYYFGGLPKQLRDRLGEDFTPFSGILASLSTESGLQDLYKFDVERDHNGMVQVSSKTASISGSYHEVSWGKSNRLNLTCLHARTTRSPHTAQWLLLDTSLAGVLTNKRARSVDDGRVLRMVASADNDLRGFYTCRAHTNRRTHNILTYGVIGKLKSRLIGPDTITVIAIVTTLVLVLGTLGWLVIEGSHDIKNGFGFFRDAHLTPLEEAETICNFIDENLHMYASKSVAELAKEKARWKGQMLASQMSMAAKVHQGFMQADTKDDSFTSIEPDLPTLPEIKSYMVSPTHDIYKCECEPCYISSPQHGSLNTSPRTRLSSSSFEISSPKLLCSRLLLVRRMHSSENLTSKRRKSPFTRNHYTQPKVRSKLLTIKSSSNINKSPANKVLLKFQQLKADDI